MILIFALSTALSVAGLASILISAFARSQPLEELWIKIALGCLFTAMVLCTVGFVMMVT